MKIYIILTTDIIPFIPGCGNEIILVVENTASNAFVHFDVPREWEKKHIGPYHEKALEFEKKLLSGGLLGPVEIYKMK